MVSFKLRSSVVDIKWKTNKGMIIQDLDNRLWTRSSSMHYARVLRLPLTYYSLIRGYLYRPVTFCFSFVELGIHFLYKLYKHEISTNMLTS